MKLKWTEKAGTTEKSGILFFYFLTILSKDKFVSRHNKVTKSGWGVIICNSSGSLNMMMMMK